MTVYCQKRFFTENWQNWLSNCTKNIKNLHIVNFISICAIQDISVTQNEHWNQLDSQKFGQIQAHCFDWWNPNKWSGWQCTFLEWNWWTSVKDKRFSRKKLFLNVSPQLISVVPTGHMTKNRCCVFRRVLGKIEFFTFFTNLSSFFLISRQKKEKEGKKKKNMEKCEFYCLSNV